MVIVFRHVALLIWRDLTVDDITCTMYAVDMVSKCVEVGECPRTSLKPTLYLETWFTCMKQTNVGEQR